VLPQIIKCLSFVIQMQWFFCEVRNEFLSLFIEGKHVFVIWKWFVCVRLPTHSSVLHFDYWSSLTIFVKTCVNNTALQEIHTPSIGRLPSALPTCNRNCHVKGGQHSWYLLYCPGVLLFFSYSAWQYVQNLWVNFFLILRSLTTWEEVRKFSWTCVWCL
jgi:hypothetical protein